MASASSSSSIRPTIKYDVFLSFRGSDIRYGFIQHLHKALVGNGILPFIDDNIDEGEAIEPKILKTIEESNISVIIFSENFAASSYCLDEVVKILECQKERGQKIVPIFYGVDPADLEEPTGSFQKVLDTWENSMSKSKVEKWRDALKTAALLKGWVRPKETYEPDLIQGIINFIRKKLERFESCNDSEDLVGQASKVEEIISFLMPSGDVIDRIIIGIWGMVGIGRVVCCSGTTGRELGRSPDEPMAGRNQCGTKKSHAEANEEILKGILGSDARQEMNQLRYKKVLIVLDDVDNFISQVQPLVGNIDYFGAGSRIIIVSRDKQVLQMIADKVYKIKGLHEKDALKLFNLYAFRNRDDPKEDYKDLSMRVIKYADGHPLALKVLGASLNGMPKAPWESAIDKLGEIPNRFIVKKLQVSYEELDPDVRRMFLDIACFFKGEPVSKVTRIFDACHFRTEYGLQVLINRCLISEKRETSGNIEMHDLLQEMGREIVRLECTELGRRSRLWNHEDIRRVLENKTGTHLVEGVSLDNSKLSIENLSSRVFAKMNGIRILNFYHPEYEHHPNLQFPESLESLPNEMKYMVWHSYPLRYLPPNFHPETLVELDLSESRDVKRLWRGVRNLPDLHVITLRECRRLIEMPDFSNAPRLEIIDCTNCRSLKKVSPSISILENLRKLNLSGCKKIKNLPKCPMSLKMLFLCYCSKINQFAQLPDTIEDLDLRGTAIEEILTPIGLFSKLKKFSLSKNLNIEKLNLSSNCNLRTLDLSERSFKSIPETIIPSGLVTLSINNCRSLGRLPELPSCLRSLTARSCESLRTVPYSLMKPTNELVELDFTDCESLLTSVCNDLLTNSQQMIQRLAVSDEVISFIFLLW
ncbi:hypothetical protein JCGZ_26633 [Jatropha curcas]|uniref:TIR domain-containing protein n=1 Tax=Jatropha curcas TaxID=180498 RepID=A0A067JIU2_JATCU|nr:hypothetical protein JCGZ_26633 [Jatropha curcas]